MASSQAVKGEKFSSNTKIHFQLASQILLHGFGFTTWRTNPKTLKETMPFWIHVELLIMVKSNVNSLGPRLRQRFRHRLRRRLSWWFLSTPFWGRGIWPLPGPTAASRRPPGLQTRIGVEFKFQTSLNFRTFTVPWTFELTACLISKMQ